ncbi:MAG: ArsR/SmtB family transcription factor [Amphiplicatus sp.]
MTRTATDGLFMALADPTRRAIFERLSKEGEESVHSLTDYVGVSQPAISKHLAMLKRAGLVKDRRAGRETFYGVDMKGLVPLIDWVGVHVDFWRGRLDALEDLLDRMDS